MKAVTRSRRGWVIVSAAAVGTILLTAVVAGRAPEQRAAACAGSLIPAYLPPQGIAELVDAAPGLQMLIVNPASGPGTSLSRPYQRAVRQAQASGARVLGYVASTFGARDPAAVLADVERYREWYGVDGIFLDEVAHGEAQVSYYRALSRSIRAASEPLVVLNPGTVPAREYFGLADVVVTFEGPFADYAARLAQAPAWLSEVPADQTAHLVYAASREQARSIFAAPLRAGHVYVTSGTPPDPWGSPPPYLREEEAATARSVPAPANTSDTRSPKCP